MKEIEAIIKHFKFDDVKNALTAFGVHGVTVTGVKGFGRHKWHVNLYRGTKYEVNFLPKITIEVVVPDRKLEEEMNIIMDSAKTGELRDVKIFFCSLQDAVRIGTGEKKEEAIS